MSNIPNDPVYNNSVPSTPLPVQPADPGAASASPPPDPGALDQADPGLPPTPAGTDLDAEVTRRLDSIESEWPASRLAAWINEFFQRLALDRERLSDTLITEYTESLIKRLKNRGYNPLTKAKYRAMLKVTVRQIEASVRAGVEGEQPGEVGGGESDRFVSVDDSTEGAVAEGGRGIWDRAAKEGEGDFITNFTVALDKDVEVLDDFESQRRFEGRLTILGRTTPFSISSDDYASNDRLRQVIFAAAGPEAQILCKVELLRTAISALSERRVARQRSTTNFGWTEDNTAFLVPAGTITREGFTPVSEESEIRVDLEGEEHARSLNLVPITDSAELTRVKLHVIQDLLACHERKVTYCLLGAAGAALCHRFAGEAGRFALWLTGLTGTGKSFLAKLFANLFGHIPLSSGRFATWGSTANYIQRQGYFFKDALYLVDDYKPDVIPSYQVVRVLQNYADGTGRGRLKVDATTNTTRPIRGLLVSTGEDIPEHSASSLPRSVVISVPQIVKDIQRGTRCAGECKNYSGVTAEFVRWFLANDRADPFTRRFRTLQLYYYKGVAGEQNDARIASNFALLGSGFVEMAKFLGDLWPGWKQEAFRFITEDLIGIRNEMLGEVKQQQASEVFLATLRELIRHKRVRVEDPMSAGLDDGDDKQLRMPVIGRVCHPPGCLTAAWQISTAMAMEAVQDSLRRQGNKPLGVTDRALLEQLREDGKLLDPVTGQPITTASKGSSTKRMWVNQARAYCFTMESRVVMDDPPPRPRPGLKAIPGGAATPLAGGAATPLAGGAATPMAGGVAMWLDSSPGTEGDS